MLASYWEWWILLLPEVCYQYPSLFCGRETLRKLFIAVFRIYWDIVLLHHPRHCVNCLLLEHEFSKIYYLFSPWCYWVKENKLYYRHFLHPFLNHYLKFKFYWNHLIIFWTRWKFYKIFSKITFKKYLVLFFKTFKTVTLVGICLRLFQNCFFFQNFVLSTLSFSWNFCQNVPLFSNFLPEFF